MERVQVLIDKLIQQKQDNESVTQLLATVQLLQEELLAIQRSKALGTAKVAVVMPMRKVTNTVSINVQRAARQEEKPEEVPSTQVAEEALAITEPVSLIAEPVVQQEEDATVEEVAMENTAPAVEYPVENNSTPQEEPTPEPVAEEVSQKEEVPVFESSSPKEEETRNAEVPQRNGEPGAGMRDEYFLRKPLIHEIMNNDTEPAKSSPGIFEIHFDAMTEAPTLLQQQPRRELHELISEQRESLNDKLKQEKIELAHVLKETPIKDLRKAIGVNDKFAFVNELFRGDEVMYERSIKTINSFHIFPEAEYWINRELKVKLGWNESKEVVQHFYQLVRRRFL